MMRVIREIGKAYYRALGYYPIRINGLKFKCDPDHAGFWNLVNKRQWEPHTYTILSKFLRPDSIYCDIGAWIGSTVIYAARICRQVICFEPDPVAFRYLLWNIELNKLHNVTPFCLALAERDGIMRMASFGGALGDSMTSLLNPGQAGETARVVTFAWDTWTRICNMDAVDFMKIDIEGGEFALLPGIQKYLSRNKPMVYLSTHPRFLPARHRKKQMQRLLDVMRIYRTCLNVQLEPVDINELTGDGAMNEFRSYIFTN